MPSAVVSMLAGVAFGFALAAPPGPMNAIIAEESVRHGWLAGVRAGLGAMVADACFFVLSLLGVVAFVGTMPRVRALMVGVGGALMLYFAADAFRGARSFEVVGTGESRGFQRALALALTNPYQILFWLTVGVGLLRPGTVDVLAPLPGGEGLLVVRTGGPAIVAGLFAGIGGWIAGFPASLVVAGERIERFGPAVAYLSAAVLGGFGLWFLGDAVGTVL